MSRIRIIAEFIARKNIRFIKGINPANVEEFLTTARAGNKSSAKQNYFNLIKRILTRAVEWGLLDYNPIGKMRAPEMPKTFEYFIKKK